MSNSEDAIKVITALADKVSQSENADILLINGDMYLETQDAVIQAIKERKTKNKNVIFLLATPGGSPDCAYRISRALQDNYEKATALIGGWCKSAGTLCVIGATQLVMSDTAELGPLDVQIARRDELGERDSGLVIGEALYNLEQHAFSLFENFMLNIKEKSGGTITFKMATEISSTVTRGLFEPLYRQIDPIKIGEAARSLAITQAYGARLNVWSKNIKGNALSNLSVSYPSHGFVIDRREAQELFRRVRCPTEDEGNIIQLLGELSVNPGEHSTVFYINSEVNDHEIKSESTGAEEATERGGKPARPKRGSGKPQANTSA